MSPNQRSLKASLAALARWANEDPLANAERGQAGLRARFERETRERYPDVGEAEILRRADCAYRAHMTGLALKASIARSRAAARARARKATADGETAA